MRYDGLDEIWKRIFASEWESLCNKSKAIAAVIVDETGKVISEGRNKIGESLIPNPRVLHAEVEAIRNLDIVKYPNVKAYTLYAALEPCPMCLGTVVMGGIRNIIVGAKDAHGGAMELIHKSEFISAKNIKVTWMPPFYGEMQRGLQAIKELLYNEDSEKLERMLTDFSVHNRKGVNAAKELVATGLFERSPKEYTIRYIFDRMSDFIEKQ